MNKQYIFDGKKFAAEKLKKLEKKVLDLNTKGKFLKLATILVGSDPASTLYVNLKKRAAEKIGVEVDVYKIKESTNKEDLVKLIKYLNTDKKVVGVMIQLPILGKLSEFKDEFIDLISLEKDVDGLRKNSRYTHPTAKAVLNILGFAIKETKLDPKTVCVIGKDGMVGSAVIHELKKTKYRLVSESRSADILISATGKEKLIRKNLVKDGAIVIDVGAPRGDVDYGDVKDKTAFITPVPGGVGPVTIASLLENVAGVV